MTRAGLSRSWWNTPTNVSLESQWQNIHILSHGKRKKKAYTRVKGWELAHQTKFHCGKNAHSNNRKMPGLVRQIWIASLDNNSQFQCGTGKGSKSFHKFNPKLWEEHIHLVDTWGWDYTKEAPPEEHTGDPHHWDQKGHQDTAGTHVVVIILLLNLGLCSLPPDPPPPQPLHLLLNKIHIHTIDFSIWSHLYLNWGRSIF